MYVEVAVLVKKGEVRVLRKFIEVLLNEKGRKFSEGVSEKLNL